MSLDKSLKGKSRLERHRNVLTRAERIERLKELGRWEEDSKALSLPKIAHRKAAVGKKGKSAREEEEKKQEEAGEGPAPSEEKK